MNNSVKTRPQRRLTQAELDSFLAKAADLLRGGVDHSEFRGYVFALLFYKRINDVYLENVAELEKELNDGELAREPMLFFQPNRERGLEMVSQRPKPRYSGQMENGVLYFLASGKTHGKRYGVQDVGINHDSLQLTAKLKTT